MPQLLLQRSWLGPPSLPLALLRVETAKVSRKIEAAQPPIHSTITSCQTPPQFLKYRLPL
eukprot:1062217-Rhodomonas_salina.2